MFLFFFFLFFSFLFLPFSSDFLASPSSHEDHDHCVSGGRAFPPEILRSILSLSNLQKNKFNKNHPLVKRSIIIAADVDVADSVDGITFIVAVVVV
jgi:hypothetical protein